MLFFKLNAGKCLNRRTVHYVLSILCIGIALEPPQVFAEQICLPGKSKYNETPLAEKTASASFWANARGSEGSISAETKTLLQQAVAAQKQHTEGSSIVLSSVPTKFLESYSDKASCEQLLSQTSKTPFTYDNRRFSSLADLNDWYGDFSQGKGQDGEDLYHRCPGKCSPQYLSQILTPEFGGNGKFVLSATVICGHARDKDDNTYKLKTSLRWPCTKGE